MKRDEGWGCVEKGSLAEVVERLWDTKGKRGWSGEKDVNRARFGS